MTTALVAVGLGLAAGVVAGLLGVGGGLLAESLPEHVLRRLFAALLLFIAGQLAWQARSS